MATSDIYEKHKRLEERLDKMREAQLRTLSLLRQVLPLALRTPLTSAKIEKVLEEVRKIEGIVTSG